VETGGAAIENLNGQNRTFNPQIKESDKVTSVAMPILCPGVPRVRSQAADASGHQESTSCCAADSARQRERRGAENGWTGQQQGPAHDHHRT
jgi:hypothetical protein